MKRLLFLSFIGLLTQFLVSCYPGGADNVEEIMKNKSNRKKMSVMDDMLKFGLILLLRFIAMTEYLSIIYSCATIR